MPGVGVHDAGVGVHDAGVEGENDQFLAGGCSRVDISDG